MGEVFTLQAGKNITAKDIKDTATELNPYKCYGGNGVRGFVASYNREGDFPIIGRQGALCGNINIAKGKFYATEHAVVVERYCDVDLMWAYYTLTTLNLNQYATATAQPGLSVAVINDVYIPIPPQKEQERISQEIEHWFALIEQIEQGKADLQTTIKQTKNRILDLAIHGKLVPQDPNDEPAIELLKRINHGFTPCDNEHSEKLPNKWCYCSFKDVFIDITSKPYQILQSQIKDSGKYPVISQSANFIEGYSDENNVFQHKRACIIFGDHTRNVKYIDFDFIVGADGAKRLPFKFPKQNEPVYISSSNKVVYIIGMSALNQPLKSLCRAELLAKFLQKQVNENLTKNDIIKVISSEQGARKDIGKREFFVILNQVDTLFTLKEAIFIAEKLTECKIKVAISSYRDEF